MRFKNSKYQKSVGRLMLRMHLITNILLAAVTVHLAHVPAELVMSWHWRNVPPGAQDTSAQKPGPQGKLITNFEDSCLIKDI